MPVKRKGVIKKVSFHRRNACSVTIVLGGRSRTGFPLKRNVARRVNYNREFRSFTFSVKQYPGGDVKSRELCNDERTTGRDLIQDTMR